MSTKPPALPIAPKEYNADYINQLTRILTQYLNNQDANTAVLTPGSSQQLYTSTLNGVYPAQHNSILNGNFQIAQRGTSFAAPASVAYDLDGWMNANSSAAGFTVAQAAGSVTGRLCRQVTITTADAAIAAGDVVNEQQRMLGYDIVKYVGQTFTVSFRAKFPVTGIHCVSLRNGGVDRSYVHEISVSAANTWADYSFTVTGGLPTAGTWNYTNGIGLVLLFTHACGSTYQTATTDSWVTGNFIATANQVNDLATIGNVWALEEVKLNLGTVATQHQESNAEMLVRCQQRYRTMQLNARGYVSAAGQTIATPLYFNMLAAPSITLLSAGITQGVSSSGVNGITNIGARFDITSSAGGEIYNVTSVWQLISEL